MYIPHTCRIILAEFRQDTTGNPWSVSIWGTTGNPWSVSICVFKFQFTQYIYISKSVILHKVYIVFQLYTAPLFRPCSSYIVLQGSINFLYKTIRISCSWDVLSPDSVSRLSERYIVHCKVSESLETLCPLWPRTVNIATIKLSTHISSILIVAYY